MEAARHLHLVDEDGVVIEDACPGCAQREDVIKGLERDIRGWAARYAELKRDKLAEAEGSPEWPVAVRLFAYWQETTGHMRSGWTLDRFQLVESFLKNKTYGKTIQDREALCRRS